MMTPPGPVLLFDGDCNLCNGFVQWVIKKDSRKHIKFANLQSPFGKKIAIDNQLDPDKIDSVFYWRQEKLYLRSDAVLQLAKDLGGVYRFVLIGYLIPARLRDYAYNLVAANRYKIMGRQSQCLMPSPELKNRFV